MSLTRWPGKAISGFVVIAIFANACVALVTPTGVPCSASGRSACNTFVRACWLSISDTYFGATCSHDGSSVLVGFTEPQEDSKVHCWSLTKSSHLDSYRAISSRQLSLLCLHSWTSTGITPASINFRRRSSKKDFSSYNTSKVMISPSNSVYFGMFFWNVLFGVGG